MNRKKAKVIVAMSGGVDSSVAAALLLEQGWDVVGVTLQLWVEPGAVTGSGSEASRAGEDLLRTVATLGIEHQIIDMREPFRQSVVRYFLDEYNRGRTPNPCAICNPQIKFSTLLRLADQMGASHVATGHYVRLEREAGGRIMLKTGRDPKKDQSYMLYRLSQEQLGRSVFPLGEMYKTQVRERAAVLNLDVARKEESQEICFIPDNDYRGFLHRHGVTGGRGPIVNESGQILGYHQGYPYYTIGQRRGLGLAAEHPLFVLAIRPEENILVVGERGALLRPGMVVEGLNLIAVDTLDREEDVAVKIRYRSAAVPARLQPMSQPGCARVLFREPQPAVTPGQAAVFYRNDFVFGGGTIAAAL